MEKSGEFWTGVPYGIRSGYHSLIITPLKDFIPDTERESFINWLIKNSGRIFKDYKRKNELVFDKWFKHNEQLLLKKEWENIYIPRYIFGMFLREKITALLETAVNENLLEYDLIQAEVTDVHKKGQYFQINASLNNKESGIYTGMKVVLSIGSPPKKALWDTSSKKQPLYIGDFYEPHLEGNIRLIYKLVNTATNPVDNNILIVGSNASALEILYHLNNYPELKNTINRLYILSPAGKFPYRINPENTLSEYKPSQLLLLKSASLFTAKQIYEALKEDMAIAESKNINIADTVGTVSKIVVELLDKLSPLQQKKFVSTYGVEIGKLQRRAGDEYRDAADELLARNKLEFIRGRLLTTNRQKKGFIYLDYTTGKRRSFLTPLKVVINCSGFEDLPQSSALIQNLILKKICRSNDSKRGFKVNENFETRKNFYVIGPLIAGNINKKLRIWHAESCQRIYFLSQNLAAVLANEPAIKEKRYQPNLKSDSPATALP